MRKDFVPFSEFEHVMGTAGLNELLFLRKARLGIYTVREWRRHGEAPAWAVEFCRMAAEIRIYEFNNPAAIEKSKVEIDPVLLAMTQDEMMRYGTSPKIEMLRIYDMVKARMNGEVVVPTKGMFE